MKPRFSNQQGTKLLAHIVTEEDGTFRYDGIGNLVADKDQGTVIDWTPYGKVREVHAKDDGVITKYRYDAAGNRTEKKITEKGSQFITRYN